MPRHNNKKHTGPVTKMPAGSPPPLKNNGPRPHGGDHTFHHSPFFQMNKVPHHQNTEHLKTKEKQANVEALKTERFFSDGKKNPSITDSMAPDVAKRLITVFLAMDSTMIPKP